MSEKAKIWYFKIRKINQNGIIHDSNVIFLNEASLICQITLVCLATTMSLIQLSKAVDVALLRSLMSSGTADIRNTDRLFSAKAENRVGRLAEEKVPVLRSYITTTSKHADTCQRRPCRRLPCSFPVLNFALSRQNIPPSFSSPSGSCSRRLDEQRRCKETSRIFRNRANCSIFIRELLGPIEIRG